MSELTIKEQIDLIENSDNVFLLRPNVLDQLKKDNTEEYIDGYVLDIDFSHGIIFAVDGDNNEYEVHWTGFINLTEDEPCKFKQEGITFDSEPYYKLIKD